MRRTSEIFSTREEKFRTSKRPCNVLFIIYYSVFAAKGAIYYVVIATVIFFHVFSRVKISCFRARAHLVFHWCLFNNKCCIECFHMTSRRPYWCPKPMKRRPCWCPKLILWELVSFLMQTLSFVQINLHR